MGDLTPCPFQPFHQAVAAQGDIPASLAHQVQRQELTG